MVRAHISESINAHFRSSLIDMIEELSIVLKVMEQVFRFAAGYERLRVCLDPNSIYIHDHVVAKMPENMFSDRF